MKTTPTLLLAQLVLLLALVATATLPSYAANERSPATLLVKWKDGPESGAAAKGNARMGGSVKRNLSGIGWQVVDLPPGMSAADGVAAYRRLEAVIAVEPDRMVPVPSLPSQVTETTLPQVQRQSVAPNDPRYNSQWYLRKIGAPAAWETTTGSADIVVAVVDTGVDYTHPDLAPNMWRNPGETGPDANGQDKATNGIDDDGDGYVDDVFGVDVVRGTGDPMDMGYFVPPDGRPEAPIYHGTFVAGLIGAVGNNGVGITGLNWSVQIMAVRIWRSDASDLQGNSDFPFYSEMVKGLDFVLQMKRRGVNVRILSQSSLILVEGDALREAMTALDAEGIASFFPAGNWTTDRDRFACFPNCYNLPSIFNVAASTETDSLATFSDYGRSTVDLAAPGVNMTSTWGGHTYSSGHNGTSASCPLTAGAAALVLSKYPDLTVDQLKAALLGSVDPLPSLRGKVLTGGRLNVARALEYPDNPTPPAIVISAFPAGQRTPVNFPIQVTFNRPMNRFSVEAAFVLTPALPGSFEWSSDSRFFTFRHDASFDSNTNYVVRILGSARDDSGATLDGNFNRLLEGSPADDFVWNFRFPVANDDFANAQLLAGASGEVSGNNSFTIWDVLEPQLSDRGVQIRANTVWYRWTPDQSGWVTFDLTQGTAFDSLLDVYDGDQIDQLIAVSDNDNYGSIIRSRTTWSAVKGGTYSIRVSGKDGYDLSKAGPFKLSWYPTPPPGFTGTQLSPLNAIPGATVRLTGTNFTGATAVLFNGASGSFTNALTNSLDLRIAAIVPPDATSGPITIVTPHGNVTSTAVFEVLPPPLSLRQINAGQMEITWAATSRAFVLETSADLNATVWPPLAQAPDGSEGQSRVVVGIGVGPRFYRLKQY